MWGVIGAQQPPPLWHLLREVKLLTVYFLLSSSTVAAASALSCCLLIKRGLWQDTYVVPGSRLLSVEDDVGCYQVTKTLHGLHSREWGRRGRNWSSHQCLAVFNHCCMAPHLCFSHWLNTKSNLLCFIWIIHTTSFSCHCELRSKQHVSLVSCCSFSSSYRQVM